VIEQDTIVSLATVAGESAIGVIRVSGNLCTKLCNDIFSTPSPTPRKSTLKNYISLNGKLIDQVLFVYFAKGKSYSGEEIIEITFHGNPLIADQILRDLLERKCRLANPGEYTKRAFLNGKIDLSQAESIAQIISAKSEVEIEIANNHLAGNLSKILLDIQSRLINLQARFEASIDFPEDEISIENSKEITDIISPIALSINELVQSGNISKSLSDGIKISLIGPPNVGKSSIFNKLLHEKRALVDSASGTTRDYLSKEIVVNGYNIEFFDTAGIRKTDNKIEALGVEKTLDIIIESKIILLVLDSSLPFPKNFFDRIKEKLNNREIIIVANKSDLKKVLNKKSLPKHFSYVECSANEIDCSNVITNEIKALLNNKFVDDYTTKIIVNKRQQNHLLNASRSIEEVLTLVNKSMSEEIILQELKSSIDQINSIIGIKDNEDMLTELFKNFCIGK
jgi:tRNA modification GTPase